MPTPDTRISERHLVDGVVRAAEDLVLGGHLRGRLESSATVTVEDGAVLEADTQARTLVVEGVVVGDVATTEDVVVAATGQVQGDIRARRLILRAGGRVSGRVETGAEVSPVRGLGRTTGGATAPPRARPEPEPTPPEPWPEPDPEPEVTRTDASAEDALAEGEAMHVPHDAAREADVALPETEELSATDQADDRGRGEVVEPSGGWAAGAESTDDEVVETDAPREDDR